MTTVISVEMKDGSVVMVDPEAFKRASPESQRLFRELAVDQRNQPEQNITKPKK